MILFVEFWTKRRFDSSNQRHFKDFRFWRSLIIREKFLLKTLFDVFLMLFCGEYVLIEDKDTRLSFFSYEFSFGNVHALLSIKIWSNHSFASYCGTPFFFHMKN